MRKFRGTRTAKGLVVGMVVAAMGLCLLSACATQSKEDIDAQVGSSSTDVANATTASAIIESSHWADEYPNEYDSYMDSKYATYSTDARHGHADSVWNVSHSKRFSAGCLRCHTGQFNSLVETYGEDFFTVDTIAAGVQPEIPGLDTSMTSSVGLDLPTLLRETTNDISCYSCHGNTPGTMEVTNAWIAEAADKGGIDTTTENLVCAQCHSLPDWSNLFDNSDSSSWSTLQVGTDPDAVWEYFQTEGYENPNVPQEIEFNTFYGSIMEQAGATCSDCHALDVTDEQGNEYTRHQWQGLAVNDELYENCTSCHVDSTAEERKAAVAQVQSDFAARRDAASAVVEQLKADLETAKTSGTMSADALDKATKAYYKAKFYYSYGKDNSEGFHGIGNGAIADCFDTATEAANEGLALLA